MVLLGDLARMLNIVIEQISDEVRRLDHLRHNHLRGCLLYTSGLKFLNPEDITKMVLWLAESDEATKFNGREIVIDLGAMPSSSASKAKRKARPWPRLPFRPISLRYA